MESTAFNRDAFYHAAWNILHSISLHGIHCIQLGSIAPKCMESTAFDQNPCTTLHGIHCIQSGSIKPRCMEYTGFNRDAFYHAASNPLHSVMPHGTTAFNRHPL